MKKLLRAHLPTPERIFSHRWLAHLRPLLGDPRLWHLGRRTVALGTAIGLFFGILIPLGQIPLAAAAAAALRANLPAAIAGTFVTNPFTTAPIYLLAYQLGAALMQSPRLADNPLLSEGLAGLGRGLATAGLPLLLGVVLLASVASVLGYVVVRGAWAVAVSRAWQRRPR